jgi:hypothetical protein
MPRVDSSSEAPSHLRKPISFLPYLAEIIISLDVLIHFLKQLLQSLGGFLAKYLAIGPSRRPLIMASMTISLGTVGTCALRRKNLQHTPEGTLMVLCALKQGLSSDWLCLKPFKTGDQHVLKLLP